MPKKRISMRKIKEVLRLRFEVGLSYSDISISVKIGQTTVREYIYRAKKAGLSWPLPDNLDDDAIEQALYPKQQRSKGVRPLTDFFYIHKELKRKGVTLQLLWEEYRDKHPNGYGYTRFCNLYKEWADKHDLWMPQQHKVGEKIFVDYAGMTIPVYSSNDNSHFDAQIFVANLGASNFTYVEATETQQLKDWIASHNRMFSFFGGAAEVLIPDNLKSGVTKPHLYEPDCNLTYHEMARHYQVAVVPTRVRKPKDKSKVEKAVLDIERQILARIRNQKFFTLEELNTVLLEHLETFNKKPFQKLSGSRFSFFMELEKPILKPLPSSPYKLGYWLKQKVNNGYHVYVEQHHYSVPYKYAQNNVEIRYNATTVEVYFKDKQIAVHQRSFDVGKYTTNHNHRPKNHQKQAECTPENLLKLAEKIGENVYLWVKTVLEDESLHISQREKKCLGTIRLSKSFSAQRLDTACKKALQIGAFSSKNIKSMLQNNLEASPLPQRSTQKTPQQHSNIRGAEYFE